jgi:release factor glutamine methyltransferase
VNDAPESRSQAAVPSVDLAAAPTLGDAVTAIARHLQARGVETPRLDARRLVSSVTGVSDVALAAYPERELTEPERQDLAAAVTRRSLGEPVARIVGSRGFHGLELAVTPATLDPRPDTETLVEGVLTLVSAGVCPGGDAPRIADLGVGTGAVLLALLSRLDRARGVGVDLSREALAVAMANATRHGLSERSCFRQGNWLDGVEGTFDLVVSNPPYIATAAIAGLDRDVRDYDPHLALDGGADGLDAYRAIARDVSRVLRPGGWIAVEVGLGQAEDVRAMLVAAVADPAVPEVRIWRDLAGIERCVAVRARLSRNAEARAGADSP